MAETSVILSQKPVNGSGSGVLSNLHLVLYGSRQEPGSLGRVNAVGEVGRGDVEGVNADQIAGGAENLGLVLRVAGDLALVLGVTGEAVHNDTLNLVLGLGVEGLDGVVHNGTALAGWRDSILASLAYSVNRSRG